MKFIVSASQLSERLQTAAKFLPTKPQLPVLGCFLFEIEGPKLTITASDADTTLVTTLDIENQGGDGRVVLQSKILFNTFGEQPLTFEIDDHNYSVKLTFDGGKYDFMGQNASDYPTLKSLNADNVSAFSVDSAKLSDAITMTSFSTANDEIRPIMNGLCFNFVESGLDIVATDGHRLSKVTLDEHPGLSNGFVFPKRPANLLNGVLSKEVGNVQIQFDDKLIVSQISAYTMITRQIEGNYPSYNSVIPTNYTCSAIVSREVLLTAMRRVQVCSDQSSSLIKMSISENNIRLSGQDIDFANSGEENIKCSYSGDNIEIGFKVTLIIDILANVQCDDIEIRLMDQARPGLFVPVQQKEGMNALMLAMPMMLA